MNAMLSPLEAAKEQLSIPALWQLLNLPGRPGNSCRSPFGGIATRASQSMKMAAWKGHADAAKEATLTLWRGWDLRRDACRRF